MPSLTWQGTFVLTDVSYWGTIAAMEHALRTYRAKNNVTLAALGRDIGVTKGYLSRVENGRQMPSLRFIKRVFEATNGEVTANDFMPNTNSEAAA